MPDADFLKEISTRAELNFPPPSASTVFVSPHSHVVSISKPEPPPDNVDVVTLSSMTARERAVIEPILRGVDSNRIYIVKK